MTTGIHPDTASPGMFSWFPIFFPLRVRTLVFSNCLRCNVLMCMFDRPLCTCPPIPSWTFTYGAWCPRPRCGTSGAQLETTPPCARRCTMSMGGHRTSGCSPMREIDTDSTVMLDAP